MDGCFPCFCGYMSSMAILTSMIRILDQIDDETSWIFPDPTVSVSCGYGLWFDFIFYRDTTEHVTHWTWMVRLIALPLFFSLIDPASFFRYTFVLYSRPFATICLFHSPTTVTFGLIQLNPTFHSFNPWDTIPCGCHLAPLQIHIIFLICAS